MASEQKLQSYFMSWFQSHDIYAVKVITATTSGHTDTIVCFDGQFIALEFKAEGQEPTPLQCRVHKKVIDSGGIVKVVHPSERDEVVKWLEQRLILIKKKGRK